MEIQMSTNLKTAVAALALALLPGFAVATQESAAPVEHVKKTCADALRDAQFLRELMKTDGDTNPELPPVAECTPQSSNT
jgi:hypothetical protein